MDVLEALMRPGRVFFLCYSLKKRIFLEGKCKNISKVYTDITKDTIKHSRKHIFKKFVTESIEN